MNKTTAIFSYLVLISIIATIALFSYATYQNIRYKNTEKTTFKKTNLTERTQLTGLVRKYSKCNNGKDLRIKGLLQNYEIVSWLLLDYSPESPLFTDLNGNYLLTTYMDNYRCPK